MAALPDLVDRRMAARVRQPTWKANVRVDGPAAYGEVAYEPPGPSSKAATHACLLQAGLARRPSRTTAGFTSPASHLARLPPLVAAPTKVATRARAGATLTLTSAAVLVVAAVQKPRRAKPIPEGETRPAKAVAATAINGSVYPHAPACLPATPVETHQVPVEARGRDDASPAAFPVVACAERMRLPLPRLIAARAGSP